MAPIDLKSLEPHPEIRPDDWSKAEYSDAVPRKPRGEVEQGIGYIRGYVKDKDVPRLKEEGHKKLMRVFDMCERGVTPLHYQAALGHPEMVKFLINETPDCVFRRTWFVDDPMHGVGAVRPDRSKRTNHHPKGQLAYDAAVKQGWSVCARMIKERMLSEKQPGPEFWKAEYMPELGESDPEVVEYLAKKQEYGSEEEAGKESYELL